MIQLGFFLLCTALAVNLLFPGNSDSMINHVLILSIAGLFFIGLHFAMHAERYARGKFILVILYRLSVILLPSIFFGIRFILK